jgi:peptidyl-prolyl cis-trans isomerase A (cyclophilin A)
MKKLLTCALFALLSACSSAPKETKETPTATEETPKPLVTPPVFRARFNTTKGPFVIEVHHDWAPRGADRFYQLIHENFYNGAGIYRVLRGFITQFGLNKSPYQNQRWSVMTIPDDPVTQHNTRGTVTYAAAGPNTRTTEVFINVANNSGKLDNQGFAPFGTVVNGMTSVVDKFYAGYGEIQPLGGQGPDPGQISSQGNQYLQIQFPNLDYIKSVDLLDASGAATPAP